MEQITINFNAAMLRQQIESAGVTQAEIARKVGVRRAAINNYISGNSKPSIDVLAKICHHLNVPMDVFFAKTSNAS